MTFLQSAQGKLHFFPLNNYKNKISTANLKKVMSLPILPPQKGIQGWLQCRTVILGRHKDTWKIYSKCRSPGPIHNKLRYLRSGVRLRIVLFNKTPGSLDTGSQETTL